MNLSLISAWKEGVSLDIDFGKQILSCGYKRICFTSLNQVSFSKFLQKCETSDTGYRYWCSYTLNENVPAKGQHYIILHRTERQCNVGYITVNWPSFRPILYFCVIIGTMLNWSLIASVLPVILDAGRKCPNSTSLASSNSIAVCPIVRSVSLNSSPFLASAIFLKLFTQNVGVNWHLTHLKFESIIKNKEVNNEMLHLHEDSAA